MEGNIAIYVSLFIIGCVFIVLIRYVNLWFFNINSIISELQDNKELLREIRNELRKKDADAPSSPQS